MGGKVKVSREVADAIEEFLNKSTRVMKRTLEVSKGILVAEHCGQDWAKYEIGQYLALNEIDTFTLMQAMVNGYEVEETPEKILLNNYKRPRVPLGYYNNFNSGIRFAIDTLGIQIKGINK